MKRPLKPGFFSVLNQIFLQDKEGALCEGLLRNTMLRTADYCDTQSFGTVLRNIMYFVEAVYSQGYSPELMTCGLSSCSTHQICLLPPYL